MTAVMQAMHISKEAMDELLALAEQNSGVVSPEQVVEAARNPESALHKYFDWDDAEAARQWRLEQARRLLRVAVTILHPQQDRPVRAFVSLVEDRRPGGGYRPITTVLADEELRKRLLQQALRELSWFRRKYATLKELAGVMRAIDEVLEPEMAEAAG